MAAGKAQAQLLEEDRPSLRFLKVLSTLITQRRVLLLPKDETLGEPKGDIDFLGWFDQENLYLLPEATFKTVARFCRETGEVLATSEDRISLTPGPEP